MRMGLALSVLTVACALASAEARSAEAECSSDVTAAFTLIERNYSGFVDKQERLGSAVIEAARRRAQEQAASATEPAACRQLLLEALAAFKDKHIQLQEKDGKNLLDSLVEAPKPAAGTAAADPEAPSFEVLNAAAALVRVPSFQLRYRDDLEALLQKHRAEIDARSSLIIDVRGNGGGTNATYQRLSELVYTQPVQLLGFDIRASLDNIDVFENEVLPRISDEKLRAEIMEMLGRMKADTGNFVECEPDSTVEYAQVFAKPERVAVLIDGRCGSSCEAFLIEARQSRKVLLAGRPSTGSLDYADTLPHRLPSGRLLFIPSTRSRRLPQDPIDGVGIQPELVLDPARFEGESRDAALSEILEALQVRRPRSPEPGAAGR